MSKSEDRRQQELDLLKKSFKALESAQAEESAPPNPGRRKRDRQPPPASEGQQRYQPGRESSDQSADPGTGSGKEKDKEEKVMMYRGRPVRTGSGAIPGAGSTQKKGNQFRGAGRPTKKSKKAPGADDLKAALNKLTALYNEGLITKAEYDTKRRQILDRL